MRRIFVSGAVTAALCSAAIFATPGFGHEFESETSSTTTTTSNTSQIFQLGSSGWVECFKLEMKTFPTLGLSPKLKLKLEKYTTCSYNFNLTGHPATTTEKCVVELTGTALGELFKNEFDEGLAKPECVFHIETLKCKIEIKEPATALPEFEWRNTDTVTGHYESLLIFRLEKLAYTITGPAECGSSGTNGEYDGSVPVSTVIVK